MRALTILLLVSLAGCVNTEKRLRDVTWGEEIDGDYQLIKDRAKAILQREFRNGLDPDLTNEDEGEFWTLWDYRMSVMYRKSKRARAHVKVIDEGDGKSRVGVAIITQINDDIDNPNSIEEARWVKTQRDNDWARRIEENIARRYLDAEPSEVWKEKHKPKNEKGKSIRPDLVDRYKDVDLGESEAKDTEGLPPLRDDK